MNIRWLRALAVGGVLAIATAGYATTAEASAGTSGTSAASQSHLTSVDPIRGGHAVIGGHSAAVTHSYSMTMSPATSGGWSSVSTEPVLYNYGLIGWAPVINPPSLPAGTVITDVCWTWNYTYPHPAAGLWVYVANNTQTFYDTSGNELGCTTLDNGESASQQFEFGFASPTSISGYYPAITPPATPSGGATITVSYTY